MYGQSTDTFAASIYLNVIRTLSTNTMNTLCDREGNNQR